MPDFIAIVLRALSFAAALQAAGLAMFMAIFGHKLESSAAAIRRLGLWSAVTGIVLVVTHHALEAARLSGDLGDVWDGGLQGQVMYSSTGAANLLRLVGLTMVATSLVRSERFLRVIGAIGAGVLASAFLLTGHTSVHLSRPLLAPLLWIHLTIIAFWLGSLPALWIASRRETPATAAQLVAAFSTVAIWLVPLIAVAGLTLAYILLPNAAALGQPYGRLLLMKGSGFLALMALAALNKWRLGPALATRGAHATTAFGRSLVLEYLVIVAVLTITAVLTSLYSPDP